MHNFIVKLNSSEFTKIFHGEVLVLCALYQSVGSGVEPHHKNKMETFGAIAFQIHSNVSEYEPITSISFRFLHPRFTASYICASFDFRSYRLLL